MSATTDKGNRTAEIWKLAAVVVIIVISAYIGYLIPRPAPIAAQSPVVLAFHRCMTTSMKPSPKMRKTDRDSAAMQRAISLIALEVDCINLSGIKGLTPAEIEQRSGLSFHSSRSIPAIELSCIDTRGNISDPALPRCVLGN